MASKQYDYPVRHILISYIVIPCTASFLCSSSSSSSNDTKANYNNNINNITSNNNNNTNGNIPVFLSDYLVYLNAIKNEADTVSIFSSDLTTYDGAFLLMAAIAKLFPSEVASKELSAVRAGIMQYSPVLLIQSLYFESLFLTSQSSQKEIIGVISAAMRALQYCWNFKEKTLFCTVFVHCKEGVWGSGIRL